MASPGGQPSQGGGRRPISPEERQFVAGYYNATRKARIGVPVAALASGVLYYGLPVLLEDLLFPVEVLTLTFFFLSIGFSLATVAIVRKAGRVRRSAATGHVVELSGFVTKLGQVMPNRGGRSLFRLQIGPEALLVPLTVYDRFQPQGYGSLAYVEGANLAIAANGMSLGTPYEVRRPGPGGR